MHIRQQTLDGASRNITSLKREIERVKATDADRLRREYSRLVQGLASQVGWAVWQVQAQWGRGMGLATEGAESRAGQGGGSGSSLGSRGACAHSMLLLAVGTQGALQERETVQWLANPALPEDIVREAIPGNIRRAEHFVAFLQVGGGGPQRMRGPCQLGGPMALVLPPLRCGWQEWLAGGPSVGSLQVIGALGCCLMPTGPPTVALCSLSFPAAALGGLPAAAAQREPGGLRHPRLLPPTPPAGWQGRSPGLPRCFV